MKINRKRAKKLSVRSNPGIRGSMFGEIADTVGERRNVAKAGARWNGRTFILPRQPKPKPPTSRKAGQRSQSRPVGLPMRKTWSPSKERIRENNRPSLIRDPSDLRVIRDLRTGDAGQIIAELRPGVFQVEIVERGSNKSVRKIGKKVGGEWIPGDILIWELS